MCHTSESSVCHTREICVVCWFVLGFVSKVVFPSCAPSTSFSWDLFSRCLFASSTGLCWDLFLRCVFSFVCAVYWFVLGFFFEVFFFFRVRRLLVCIGIFFLRCVFSFVCVVYWFVLGFVFEVCFFFRVRRLLVCIAICF